MNYEKFLELERVSGRMSAALRHFADAEDCQAFSEIAYVLAELRLAADFICDPEVDEPTKQQARERLLQLFTKGKT